MMFTLTDVPPVEGLGIELPIEATRPMDDCYKLLADAVNAGTFTIVIPANSGSNAQNITSSASGIYKYASISNKKTNNEPACPA